MRARGAPGDCVQLGRRVKLSGWAWLSRTCRPPVRCLPTGNRQGGKAGARDGGKGGGGRGGGSVAADLQKIVGLVQARSLDPVIVFSFSRRWAERSCFQDLWER